MRISRDGHSDLVAIEEPLEIRVCGEPVVVTMRTPGRDEDPAAGFLYGEGLILEAPEIGLTDDFAANTIEIRSPLVRKPVSRRFYATSSCGVCGKGALEDVAVYASPIPEGPVCARGLRHPAPDDLSLMQWAVFP